MTITNETVTLTAAETAIYDSGDDCATAELRREWLAQAKRMLVAGAASVEIYTADGITVDVIA